MRSPQTLLVALPLAALAIAGCGGGGDDSTESAPVATIPTTTALTKAELISQGDAICAEINAAVGTVGGSEAGGGTTQVADLYSGMVESLKNLGTPDDTAGYSEFIAAAEELSQAEDEVKLAAEREDETALATAQASASSALASFQSAAQVYGFEDCGEGPSAPSVTSTGEPSETGSSEAPEEAPEPEAEAAPEPAPETGGAGGTAEEAPGGGTAGGAEGGGTSGGGSGGIGPG